VEVIIQTEFGPKKVCGPRWGINIYSYLQDGKRIREAWIPDWLCKKANLLKDELGSNG